MVKRRQSVKKAKSASKPFDSVGGKYIGHGANVRSRGDSSSLRASRKAAEFNEYHDIAQIKQELDEVIRVLRLVCVILGSTRTLPKEIVEWAGGRIPQLVKYKNPLGPSR